MPSPITVLTFDPDGSPPSEELISSEGISPRWFSVGMDLLNTLGPVFNHNMGGTLSHLDVRMGGPMGQLMVGGNVALEFAISRGTGDEQDRASVDHFIQLHSQACRAAGSNEVAPAAVPATSDIPILMYFDYYAEISDQNYLAVAQLGLHLASAYIDYCTAGQQGDSADRASRGH